MAVLQAPIIDKLITAYVEEYRLYFYSLSDININKAIVYIDNEAEEFDVIENKELLEYGPRAPYYVSLTGLEVGSHKISLALRGTIEKDGKITEVETEVSTSIIINGIQSEPTLSSITINNTAVNINIPDAFDYIIKGNCEDYTMLWVRIFLRDSNGNILEDSGRIQINSKNFEYKFKSNNLNGSKLQIFYYTEEGYLNNTDELSLATVSPTPGENFGACSLSASSWALIFNFTSPSYTGEIIVYKEVNGQRTKLAEYSQNKSQTYNVIDASVVAAEISTKYCVWLSYTENGQTYRSEASIELSAPFYFEDIYLIDGEKFLTIKYNPELTNLKWNYADTITPTIGNAYPVVRRNGYQKYKTFTIGGLISYNSELDDAVVNPVIDSVFGNSTTALVNSLNSHFLNQSEIEKYKNLDKYYQEALIEKLFRDRVLNFLQDGKVKLFKSLPEGNMLIRLSNITLTSNKTLDRNIYSFTAQATEMAEATYENCVKYGISADIIVVEDPIYYNEYIVDMDETDALIIDQIDDDTSILTVEQIQTEI